MVSLSGTNSFIDGNEQTSTIFNSTINSVESTPINKAKTDNKSRKYADLLKLEINEYK